jgi:hypothetical protein
MPRPTSLPVAAEARKPDMACRKKGRQPENLDPADAPDR